MSKDTFVPCGIRGCTNGYIMSRGRGEIFAEKCKCLEEYQAHVRLKSRLAEANISPLLADYTLGSYIGPDLVQNLPRLQKYVAEFESRYKTVHLYFWSTENGTQKTTLASWIGKELLQANLSVKLVLMDTLVKLLQDKSFNEEKAKKAELYENCDLLIIDDAFDPKKQVIYKSGYQISFMDAFLRQRLELSRKATIFTSNIPPDSIDRTIFGVSLAKLVQRTIFPMNFADSIELRNDFRPESLWE